VKTLILPFRDVTPRVADDAFIAPGAVVIGDVEIGPEANIWFHSVLRGDVNSIRVGARTSIQDGSVVHVSRVRYGTEIGADVMIGHRAMIHACVLEDGCFVGMGATVMDGAVVEGGAMIAAGALVTPGKKVKRGELWTGTPATFKRELTKEERTYMIESAARYVALGREYRQNLA
jgi:carbonic anhydrase/acetyltransferase-like protein (isoleucine patch superfamily)